MMNSDASSPQSAGSEDVTLMGESTRPGTIIGHYKLIEQVGEGGFGLVFLAEQSEPVRRRVALKLLKPGMDSKQIVARFQAERQALAMMDHPGVAKVYDAGMTSEGRPYFAMEYVPGTSITDFCRQERLDLDARIRLIRTVCDAVQHAHMKGVIHRDLKPSNILVELVDQEPVAKVIDFGVAKALSQPLTDMTIHTLREQMIGTPEYMSPEQARGGGVDVDTRADVYSLGAILYELLTGSPPIDPQTLRRAGFAGIQQAIEESEPARPSTRVTTITGAPGHTPTRLEPSSLSRRLRGDLDWIVMRCLEKERNRRYDSAAALGRDLRRFLANEPVEAGPPGAAYRLRKFVHRNRGLVGATVTIAAVMVIASIVSVGFGVSAVKSRNAMRAAQQDLEKTLEQERDARTRAELAEQQATASAEAARQARDESEAMATFLGDMIASPNPVNQGFNATMIEVVDAAADELGEAFVDQPLVEARMREKFARTYRSLGRYDDARRHAEVAVTIFRREAGADDPRTLTSLHTLGVIFWRMGQLDDAATMFDRLADARARTLGANHADTLATLNNVANLLRARRRFAEARDLHADVLERQREHVGPEDPQTLKTLNNLAIDYAMLDDFETAAELHKESADLTASIHGRKHPDTLAALNNLAADYMNLNQPEDALPILEEVLTSRLEVLGEESPQTLGSMNNLAWMLAELLPAERQDVPRAIELLQRTVDVGQRIEAPNLHGYMDMLARVYDKAGRSAEAIEMQQRAIERLPAHASAADREKMSERLRLYQDTTRHAAESGDGGSPDN